MSIISNVEKKEDRIILKVVGRIDTSNADEFEKEIGEAVSGYEDKTVYFDCEELQYISSVGLRCILKTIKRSAHTEIINVSNEVYDIFDVVGFTEIAAVRKKYRELSVDGLKELGVGTTGTVYQLDEDKVLKVFNEGFAEEIILGEQERSKKVFLAGVPCAVPYDVVKVGSRLGLVFEMVKAETLKEPLVDAVLSKNQEKLAAVIDEYVDYAKQIHSVEVKQGELLSAKKDYFDLINALKGTVFSEDDVKRITDRINEIPDSDHFIHGDLNFSNVIKTEGELMLIDVATAVVGDPIFEFAQCFTIMPMLCKVDPNYEKALWGMSLSEFEDMMGQVLKKYYNNLTEEEFADTMQKLNFITTLLLIRAAAATGAVDKLPVEIIDSVK